MSCSSPEQVSKKLGVHDGVHDCVHDENILYLAQHEQLLIAGGRSDQVGGSYWCPYHFVYINSFIYDIIVRDVPKKYLI